MQDRLQAILDKFAALSGREQWLILIAVFAVAYQVGDLVVLDRQYQRVEALNRAISADNAAIVGLNTQLNQLVSQAQNNPNVLLRKQIAALRDDVGGLRQRLQAATGQMISPQDMARFLEELLVQEQELILLSLRTLEGRPLLGAEQTGDKVAPIGATLHRHGFEVTFSGGYLPTLRYLQALERLPWRFYWDSVSYEVIDYPRSIVRMQLHTLSLSEDWIGV